MDHVVHVVMFPAENSKMIQAAITFRLQHVRFPLPQLALDPQVDCRMMHPSVSMDP